MSVGILTVDGMAADALSFALRRAGQIVWTESTIEAARARISDAAPQVLLADAAVDEYEELIREVLRHQPWTRVHRMTESAPCPGVSAISKPFDAGEVAELLTREQRLAQSEQQRLELHRQLEHSERLVAIGRLAASMAHEINNPLSVVCAAASAFAEAAARHGDEELGEWASDVGLAANRIHAFVQHICGYARRERPALRDASPAEALDGAVRMVRPRARDRGVELLVQSASSATVPHDTTRISQAVLNLLSNAVDAAAGGGRHVWLQVQVEADGLRIVVEDDGPGLPPDLLGSVFEPFVTTKLPGEGTGLGLAITQQIVTDHGGSVTLLPREGSGVRAEVFLPAFRPDHHRVAVVADDPSMRRALVVELQRAGFQVESARKGGGAGARLEQQPHVLVSDQLPAGSTRGHATGRVGRGGAMAQVVVTAHGELPPPDADVHVFKPWRPNEIAAAVRAACLLRRPER